MQFELQRQDKTEAIVRSTDKVSKSRLWKNWKAILVSQAARLLDDCEFLT